MDYTMLVNKVTALPMNFIPFHLVDVVSKYKNGMKAGKEEYAA